MPQLGGTARQRRNAVSHIPTMQHSMVRLQPKSNAIGPIASGGRMRRKNFSGHCVDGLDQHQREAVRPPGPVDAPDEVENEPPPQHEEVQQEQEIEDIPEEGDDYHPGCYDWAKKDASASGSSAELSPDTTTCEGERRNTLAVTRSILP
jgi:hypothetical protein